MFKHDINHSIYKEDKYLQPKYIYFYSFIISHSHVQNIIQRRIRLIHGQYILYTQIKLQ